MSFDLRALKIYIDGSCRKNPGGRGGFAARVEYPFGWDFPDELVEYRGFFETNNNRMELRACLFAHEWTLEHIEELAVLHVQIVTDSMYVYENYNRSVGWSQNSWVNFHKRPIRNIDLWKDLLRVRKNVGRRVRIEMKLIKGKTTPITKEVDRDAKTAALQPSRVDIGFRPGKVGRSKNNNKAASKMYPAAGQVQIIRVYQTESERRDIQRVKFQTYSNERLDFFDKFFAYTTSEIGNVLHRSHVYRIRMNDMPQYPQILEILEELEETDIIAVKSEAK